MSDNPFFKGPDRIVDPLTSDRPKVSLLWSSLQALRFLVGCCAFIIFPLVISPYFKELYEEYGFDLPALTVLLFSISRRILSIAVIYIPLVFVALAGAEVFIFAMPKSRPRTLLNILLWLVILFTLARWIFSCWLPYQAVLSGLAA